jgi:phosphatidylglycerol:prolipoprotein diacylglycerol transferase
MLKYIYLADNSYLSTYNLLIGIGIAFAMLNLQYDKKFNSLNLKEKNFIHIALLSSLIIGFIGAYLFDAFTKEIKININNFNKIGFTLYGGMIIGLLTFVVILKNNSKPLKFYLNMITPSFCIGLVIGRVGCFFAGCCFGTPTSTFLGVRFPKDSLPSLHYENDVLLHPTQLYESFYVLCIFFILKQTFIKNKFFLFLILYSIFRFFIEYIRADERGVLFNQTFFSPSQLISLIIIFVLSVLFFLRRSVKI